MKNLFRTFVPFVFFVVALSGCMLPIRSQDMPKVLEQLSMSNASACVVTGASGGAGAMPITPLPSPAGGWGKANFTFCRSNEPGSEIAVTDSGITIKHGMAIAKELTDRLDTLETAVELMLQRMIGIADEPKKGATF